MQFAWKAQESTPLVLWKFGHVSHLQPAHRSQLLEPCRIQFDRLSALFPTHSLLIDLNQLHHPFSLLYQKLCPNWRHHLGCLLCVGPCCWGGLGDAPARPGQVRESSMLISSFWAGRSHRMCQEHQSHFLSLRGTLGFLRQMGVSNLLLRVSPRGTGSVWAAQSAVYTSSSIQASHHHKCAVVSLEYVRCDILFFSIYLQAWFHF